jgi:DNA-binding GntR family transcriptional regulator
LTEPLRPLAKLDLRANSVDAVANQLRRELLSSAIPPGSRILPNEVAKRFSVSHIPVREALRQLESENLIVRTPQGATYAAEIGLDDLDGLYDLRRLIEGDLAWRSAGIRTEDDVQRVAEAWDELTAADPYTEEFFAAHRAFHWSLLAPAGNAVSRRVLEVLWLGVDRYLGLAASMVDLVRAGGHFDVMMHEHRGLQLAFGAGDADRLRDLLVEHLANTETRLRAIYSDLLPPYLD